MGGLLSTKKVPAWHSGPEWAAFLGMYDERAAAELPGFASQLIHTTAGQTFVWTGGRADGLPVVFFHGARGSSLSWADVLLVAESLRSERRVILVDYICDAGRSVLLPPRPPRPPFPSPQPLSPHPARLPLPCLVQVRPTSIAQNGGGARGLGARVVAALGHRARRRCRRLLLRQLGGGHGRQQSPRAHRGQAGRALLPRRRLRASDVALPVHRARAGDPARLAWLHARLEVECSELCQLGLCLASRANEAAL